MSVISKTTMLCGADRGTERGYQIHKRSESNCSACSTAHRAYVDDLMNDYGITTGERSPNRPTRDHPQRDAFVENYLWLWSTGVRNREAIAKRLHLTPDSLDRKVYVCGLHPLHVQAKQARKAA